MGGQAELSSLPISRKKYRKIQKKPQP